MVYLYKKLINGTPYFYLRLSTKIKNKVIVKDIAYLGNNPDKLEKKIDDLPQKYKEDIRKSYKNIKKTIESEYYLNRVEKIKSNEYIEYDKLKEIEAIKIHFNNKFLKLDKNTINESYKGFLINFAYNTTSIEGNTITLKEAEKLLRENFTPNNKELREVFDLQNTEKVFIYLLNERPNLNEQLIVDIHDMLVENIDNRLGYREHEIRVFKSHFETTPVKYIKTDMKILLDWYKEHKAKLHPLVLACIFHQKFEKIHPFADGNGRTGRMMLNYILLKNGYPPLIIRKSQRSTYLDSLAKGDKADLKNNDKKYFAALIEHCSNELIFSYWNNFLL